MKLSGWQNYPENSEQLSELFTTQLKQVKGSVSQTEQACESLLSLLMQKNGNSCSYYDQIMGLMAGAASVSRLFNMVLVDSSLQNVLEMEMAPLFDWQAQVLEKDCQVFSIIAAEYQQFHFQSAESRYRFYQNLYKKQMYLGRMLDSVAQEQIAGLWHLIGEYSYQFEQAITIDDKSVHVKPYKLHDIATEYVQSLPQAHDGCVLVYADSMLLSSSHDPLARKAFWRLSTNAGYPANKNTLEQLIFTRDNLAKKLGYTSFAHLDIEYQMAQTPENVDLFLSRVAREAQKKVQAELEAMLACKPRDVMLKKNNGIVQLRPWDLLRLKAHYKDTTLDCSSSFIAEFFPVEHVLQKLFQFFEELFGIQFKILRNTNFWDRYVHGFEVWSRNRLCGYIICDMYARQNKYRYTLEKPILPSTIDHNNQWRAGVTVIVSSLLSPRQQQAPLFDLQDISTLAHEMGHALHTIFGAQQLITQSGTALERDFVEAPGQMLEHWVLNSRVLKELSCHYTSGRSLTDDEIAQIQKTCSFDQNEKTLEQVLYSRLSLEYFLEGKYKDIDKIYKKLSERVRPYIMFDYHDHGYASFDHLVSYGSRYYGYLWSSRFAQKIYTELAQEADRQNTCKNIGVSYIQKVIEQGGSASPWTLLSNFFGTTVEDLKHSFLYQV